MAISLGILTQHFQTNPFTSFPAPSSTQKSLPLTPLLRARRFHQAIGIAHDQEEKYAERAEKITTKQRQSPAWKLLWFKTINWSGYNFTILYIKVEGGSADKQLLGISGRSFPSEHGESHGSSTSSCFNWVTWALRAEARGHSLEGCPQAFHAVVSYAPASFKNRHQLTKCWLPSTDTFRRFFGRNTNNTWNLNVSIFAANLLDFIANTALKKLQLVSWKWNDSFDQLG